MTLSATGLVSLDDWELLARGRGGQPARHRHGRLPCAGPHVAGGEPVCAFDPEGPWQAVGKGPTTFTGQTGELFLAVNDHYAKDNGGDLRVTIVVGRASP
ncbi:MAG: hypothetical protein VKQ33_01420 [Candidatus Sericytochromatia bacterium]|nr:hypothetical protein [Candidatus Sericytochromatia bacterium]